MGKEQELRPCPLCRTDVKARWSSIPKRFAGQIHCDGCGLELTRYGSDTQEYETRRALVSDWNRRSSDEQAEVVAWIDRHVLDGLGPTECGTVYGAPQDRFSTALYRSPAVAGGVTDGMVKRIAKAGWERGRRSWCPAGVLADNERSDREWARVLPEILAAIAVGDEGMGEEPEACPICAVTFKPDDLCQTDIELGTCHAACLEGSPLVNLQTGDPLPVGSTWPTPYRYDSLLPTPPIQGNGK